MAKYLDSTGLTYLWGKITDAISSVDALPSQSGQSGKFLKTNGTSASWSSVPQEIYLYTATLTAGYIIVNEELSTMEPQISSGKIVGIVYDSKRFMYSYTSSGSLYFVAALNNQVQVLVGSNDGMSDSWSLQTREILPDQTSQSGKFLTTNGTTASWADNPPELFIIALTIANNTITADKTFAEITAAHTAGQVCIARDGQREYTAVYFHSTQIVFSRTATASSHTFTSVMVCSNADEWVESGIDNQPLINSSGILKGDGSGGVTAATAGTDYQAPLPSQSGQSGKVLTTNGSALSWGSVDSLPSQSGQSGKFLTTNGTTASWASLPVYNGSVI